MSEISPSIWESMINWFTPTVLFVLLNLMIGTIAITSNFTTQKQKQNEPKNSNNNIARTASVLQRLKSINFYAHYRSQEPQNPSIHRKQTPDSNALFNPEPNRSVETESHEYFFQQFHQENVHQIAHQPQEPYVLEENQQKLETQFVFEQNDSNLGDFEEAHDEEVEENDDEMLSMDEIYSQLSGGNFSRCKSDTKPASGEMPAKLPARMRKSASLKSAFGHFEEAEKVEARRPATVRERGTARVRERGTARVTDGDQEVDAKADDFINRFKQQLKLQRLDSIMRYKDMIARGFGGGK